MTSHLHVSLCLFQSWHSGGSDFEYSRGKGDLLDFISLRVCNFRTAAVAQHNSQFALRELILHKTPECI